MWKTGLLALLVVLVLSAPGVGAAQSLFGTDLPDLTSCNSAACLNKLSASDLARVPSSVVNGLVPSELKDLKAATIDNLSGLTKGELSLDAVKNFSSDALGGLSAGTIASFSADTVLSQLDLPTLSGFSTDTLNTVAALMPGSYTALMAAASGVMGDAVASLLGGKGGGTTAFVLNNMQAHELLKVPVAMINGLPEKELKNLSAHVIWSLSATQMAQIEAKVIEGLSESNKSKLSITVINQMAPAQRMALTYPTLRLIQSATLQNTATADLKVMMDKVAGYLFSQLPGDLMARLRATMSADAGSGGARAMLDAISDQGLNLLKPVLANMAKEKTDAGTAAKIVQDHLDSSHGKLIQNWLRNGLRDMAAQEESADTLLQASTGKMMDAENQLTAQRELQGLQARAYKDYTPSENVCRFGTLAGSLAASDMMSQGVATLLNRMMMDRETHKGTGKLFLPDSDRLAMITGQAKVYCDPQANDGTPVLCACERDENGVCKTGPKSAQSRINRDIHGLMQVPTLDIRAGAAGTTPDLEDVRAMLSQLSAFRPPQELTSVDTNEAGALAHKNAALGLRNVTAQRGPVHWVLAHYFGARARGAAGSANFLGGVMKEMGLADGEVSRALGGGSQHLAKGGGNPDLAPSYDAQMRVLAKVIYQSPNFYTNLIDKPANVERIRAAQMAIALMQKWDFYESTLRRELMLSQLLEQEVKTEAASLENRFAE